MTFLSLLENQKSRTSICWPPGLVLQTCPWQQADSHAWPAASTLWNRFADLSFQPPPLLHVLCSCAARYRSEWQRSVWGVPGTALQAVLCGLGNHPSPSFCSCAMVSDAWWSKSSQYCIETQPADFFAVFYWRKGRVFKLFYIILFSFVSSLFLVQHQYNALPQLDCFVLISLLLV